ncbi:hypothetical protein [Hyalangium gracile]|uniref:hypothetical protein n=1 Tax=Hyalangium gracile TaxID=394092 RepID=UPI001CC9A302|nr:hypothetical protein [Hyalangium gracile]
MIQFRDRELTNERLVLDSKTELYYLGHDLTLRDCILVLKVPAKALVITKARLIGCVIEVKQELKNFHWSSALLRGCRFTGHLSGNDFGSWPDEAEEGAIEECDFTAAQLHGCRFIDCDTTTLRFPSWPCFTLLNPVRRLHELNALHWPGQVQTLIKVLARNPESLSAVTYSATALAEKYDASEQDIRATVEKLGGVIY